MSARKNSKTSFNKSGDMTTTGILLINLGTPDHCDPKSVRRYLKEFLSDPRVVDIPASLRWLLLNAVILPFRPKKSAEAYAKIWSPQGSPLLQHSIALKNALATELGNNYKIALGMRYGNPSIASALTELKSCARLTILPLFPQYSSAATGSAMEKALTLAAKQWNIPEISVIRDFYDHPAFINAYAQIIQQHIANKNIDVVLFSYHGLPERHITKSQCQANCQHINNCPPVNQTNQFCYRAQCYATSRALSDALNLNPEQHQTSFQSRLGRVPWIKPYTDEILPELIKKGVRNIAVACPSFVADCLETLEEIGIRAKEQWQELGGNELITVPCLNAEDNWVKAVVEIINLHNRHSY